MKIERAQARPLGSIASIWSRQGPWLCPEGGKWVLGSSLCVLVLALEIWWVSFWQCPPWHTAFTRINSEGPWKGRAARILGLLTSFKEGAQLCISVYSSYSSCRHSFQPVRGLDWVGHTGEQGPPDLNWDGSPARWGSEMDCKVDSFKSKNDSFPFPTNACRPGVLAAGFPQTIFLLRLFFHWGLVSKMHLFSNYVTPQLVIFCFLIYLSPFLLPLSTLSSRLFFKVCKDFFYQSFFFLNHPWFLYIQLPLV